MTPTPEQIRKYGAVGSPVANSNYVRDYCACGAPIRVRQANGRNRCQDCRELPVNRKPLPSVGGAGCWKKSQL